MRINLLPQRRDDTLVIVKTGDVLTINGTDYDFTSLPDGADLSASATDCKFLTSMISRVGGELQLSVIMPYQYGASEAARFPAPIIDPPDGLLTFPS